MVKIHKVAFPVRCDERTFETRRDVQVYMREFPPGSVFFFVDAEGHCWRGRLRPVFERDRDLEDPDA